MNSCTPARKVMASAVSAGASVLLLDTLGLDLSTQAAVLLVTGSVLLVGYLVPPAAADCLDRAPSGPRKRQVTAPFMVS